MAITIADILNQWQTVGVFDYILPFLLIFAIVWGILRATKILGDEKGVHVIIAIVVGLLALRLNFLSAFTEQLFPRLGVGLASIVALLILVGLFVNSKEAKYWGWGLAAIAGVVWILVLVGSFQNVGWVGGYGFFEDYAGLIIGGVLLVGVIIAVVASKSTNTSTEHERHEWKPQQ